MGAKKKPSQFKVQDNEVGLILRSALPEELEWDTRAEDVALSLDTIKRCLSNILVALDRDTPQTKQGLALPINFSTQELIINQEPPWLWFTHPELGFLNEKDADIERTRTTICSICLESFVLGDQVTQFLCAHPLHFECARQWFIWCLIQNHAGKCPVCNTIVIPVVFILFHVSLLIHAFVC